MRLRCAVEAKLLDTSGALDAPSELDGVDLIHVAEHRVPLNADMQWEKIVSTAAIGDFG